MIIDLQQLKEPTGQISADGQVTFKDVGGDERVISAHTDVTYRETGGQLYFHGEVKGTFETACHICAEALTYNVDAEFDVVVRRSGDVTGTIEDDTGVFITINPKEHEVSLSNIIYESLLVAIPMRLACAEYDTGKCPNIAVAKEAMELESDDPRWDSLRKLKESRNE